MGPRGGGSNSRLVSSRPTNPSDGHPHAVSFENHYDTHSFFADVVVRTCTHGDRFLAAREREGVAVSRAAAMIERERERRLGKSSDCCIIYTGHSQTHDTRSGPPPFASAAVPCICAPLAVHSDSKIPSAAGLTRLGLAGEAQAPPSASPGTEWWTGGWMIGVGGIAVSVASTLVAATARCSSVSLDSATSLAAARAASAASPT